MCLWVRKVWVRHCDRDSRRECPQDIGPSSGREQNPNSFCSVQSASPGGTSEEGINLGSQWVGLRVEFSWLVITRVLAINPLHWQLGCHVSQDINSVAQMMASQGVGWSPISSWKIRICGKASGSTSKNLSQSPLFFLSWLMRHWHPLEFQKLVL